MLSRRKLYKALALGVLSAPLFLKSLMNDTKGQKQTIGSGLSDEKIDWEMTTTWPPNFPILGEGCQLFATLLHQMSGGRLNIKVYGGGEKVPPLEAFSAVQSGAMEIGSGASYYWAGKIPSAPFFATVPFGLNATQHTAWMLFGGGMELWKEAYEPYNLIPFLGGNTGVQMGGWFNREINTLEDIKGLKMRIPGIGGKVFERAGGAPVLLPGSEIYTGLERQIIDATEWLGPYHDILMGFHEIAEYYYTPGWHEPGTALEFFVNKDHFQSLSPDLQAMFQSASMHVHTWMWHKMEAENAKALEGLYEQNIKIREYPPQVLARLKEITKEVIAEMATVDDMSNRAYQSFEAYRSIAKNYAAITEKRFYDYIQ